MILLTLGVGRGWVFLFSWGGGGLGWITGEGDPESGDKHIFNGWRGGRGVVLYLS